MLTLPFNLWYTTFLLVGGLTEILDIKYFSFHDYLDDLLILKNDTFDQFEGG